MAHRTLVAVALICGMAVGHLAQAQFETRASLAIYSINGFDPYSLVVGDFNRDGILDLAAVGTDPSGSVLILFGNGDGTFREGATYAVGVAPQYPVTASLRNNGILDLVVGDRGSDNVWVMLGNGDGTFQPAVAYPTTAKSYMAELGEFAGSSSLDIVTTEADDAQGVWCNCVEVLPGNGDGTFGTPITTPLPYGLTAYAIVPGDFNDDGKLDLAAGGESFPNNEVAILLGNGNGTFNADGNYVVAPDPFSLATGYFTSSNRKLDLAVVGGGLDVLLGNGNGTFQSAVAYETSIYGVWVVAAELFGNGKVDLAVADPGAYPSQPAGVSVYKGNGDGTFQKGMFYHVGSDEGGDYVAAGDFNGDGKPDLIVLNAVNGIVTTLLNTGVVTFSPTTPLNFKKQAVGTTSSPQTVKLTNTGSTELKIQSMKASAGFGVTSTCGDRVAAGANCTISATFSPTKQGAATGTISIIDNASSKPQVIELIGTGT